MQPIDYLGSSPLFLGVETENWTISDFQAAARNAKALGCTSLLTKIADGTNIYYGNLGGWQKVIDAINQVGIRAVPYTYCYGDKFGGLVGEDNILAAAMRYAGCVIGDMEVEFNGRVDWAQAVAAALEPVPGLLGITTWADPQWQDWPGVLAALRPATNFWLPQVYSSGLADVYHAQFDPLGVPYFPILNLGTEFGANDPVTIARVSNSPIVGFWEYQAAISSYAPVVKQITAQKGPQMAIPQGWKDDGSVLTAPNGVQVVRGFRDFVLSHNWSADNFPLDVERGTSQLELGNPALGGGTYQQFTYSLLEWTSSRGVFVAYVGKELSATRSALAKTLAQVQQLQQQVQALQTQVQQLQQQQPIPVDQQLLNSLTQRLTQIEALAKI